LAGTLSRIEVDYPDGRVHQPHALEIIPHLPAGTVSVHEGGGGGGYGSPLGRDPRAGARGLRDGLIPAEGATQIYGVGLTADAAGVDDAATTARREALREPSGATGTDAASG